MWHGCSRKTWVLTWVPCSLVSLIARKCLSEEPTIVAIEVADQKMVAVGQEARDMYGRVPESIEVARPLKNGVIADYEITETLLSYLLQRVSGSMRIFRPARDDLCSLWGDQRGAPRGL